MGKIRIRTLGITEIEEKQKKQSKKKQLRKKKPKIEVKTETELKEEVVVKIKSKKHGKKKIKQPVGKKHREAKKKINKRKTFSLSEAIKLVRKIAYAGFNESVELHINMNTVGLKGKVVLPHDIGKNVKVAIVDDVLLAKIEEGSMDFDVLIAHPSYMKKLVKYARILGPKGLMPNSKNGTVSTEPEKTAKEFMGGNLRWKTEAKFPIIHQMIGKLSFKDKELEENAKVFLEAIKTSEIKDVYLKSTMSPAVKIVFPLVKN